MKAAVALAGPAHVAAPSAEAWAPLAPRDIRSTETPPSVGAPVTFARTVGMLYPGDGPLGVLMLGAIGYEEMCVRTTWRTLAETLSAAGAPCLRFDYPGVGDALDPETAPEGLDDWFATVRAAADVLRGATGCERIVVIGQGFGGALAALVAETLGPVEATVFMAPVTSGRIYLRELSLWARMLTDRIGIDPDPDDAGGHAVAGLTLEPGRARAIKGLDLLAIGAAPSANVLMVGRVNHGGDARFAKRLIALGADVTRLDYEGYEILATDPTQATPPLALVEAIAAYVAERAAGIPASSLVSLKPAAAVASQDDGFRERPLRFGRDQRLFGVLCEPAGVSDGRALVFCNAGRDYHIGWARVTVDHARALARLGVASLRFDAAGIGDSPAAPGSSGEVLYSQGQIDDVRAAVDQLQALGYGRTTLVGRCSGAYAAFNAAVQDERIHDVIMVNAERFVWDPRENIAEALRYAHRSIGDFGATLWKRGGWTRLLKGQLRVSAAGTYVAHRLLRKIAVRAAPMLGELTDEAKLYREVHRRFGALARRGARVCLVYSEGDLGLSELHTYFGEDGRKLASYPNVRRAMVKDADHNFTHKGARARLLATLSDILGR